MESKEFFLQLRKEKGLSQVELAEELGITRQAISRWETGVSTPSVENLIGLSRVYGMTVEEMMQNYSKQTEEAKPPAEEAPLPEPGTKRRSRKVPVIFLAVYLCFAVGIFLWGKLTNAPSMAANYLICVTLILILGWFAYFFHLLFQFIRRMVKK